MKYAEMNREEKLAVDKQFSVWLRPYTYEVIKRVMARADEILENEFSMHLLKELCEREAAEDKDFESSIAYMLSDYAGFAEYNPHNHCTTHSKAYRDVLYDLYIRPQK